MTTIYTRVLGVDFTETDIHISSFYNDLKSADLPETQAIYRDGNNVTVKFASVLNETQLTTFNNLCTNYTYIIYDNVYVLIKDVKSVGTNGGDAIQNTWTTRDLNTIEGNQNFTTLTNNQFTLNQAGSYQIQAQAPASNVRNHQIRLYDIISSSVIATGTSAYSSNKTVTYSSINTVIIKGESNMTLELQHIVDKSNNNQGFGIASAFDSQETYSVISILRV